MFIFGGHQIATKLSAPNKTEKRVLLLGFHSFSGMFVVGLQRKWQGKVYGRSATFRILL
jgi:hypothetical protein